MRDWNFVVIASTQEVTLSEQVGSRRREDKGLHLGVGGLDETGDDASE